MDISSITGKTYISGTTPNVKTDSDGNVDFSTLLSETLQSTVKEQVISMTGSTGGAEAPGVQTGGGIESAILAAAASGQTEDAEIAVFMLCMMMQSEQNSDIAPLLNLMSGMLTQLDSGDKGAIRNKVMSSEFDAYVKDSADSYIFGNSFTYNPKTVEKAVLPTEAWRPSSAAVTSDVSSRSAENLREVIDQFDVENSGRYVPYRNGTGADTYCNIFLWDVTRALGCEIPHYVDAQTGMPRQYPDVKGAKELGANSTYDWLVEHGGSYGWREVSAEQAQAAANSGKPAVTAWNNPSGRAGHVQVVCPSENGGYDSLRGVTVAQSGARNSAYTYLSSTFNQGQRSSVKYFVHD